MQRYGSRGPYDQRRDPYGSSPRQQGSVPPVSTDNGCGFNGEPLSRPPARSASGTVRRSRTDNSIEFPAQPRRPAGTARNSSGTSRPRQGSRNPQGSRNSRNNRNVRSGARQYNKNQKLRPTGQSREPIRRERQNQRRLTRAAMRRRRLMGKLTALGLLLCVIGAGTYLTVTMLFRINSIQLQSAEGKPVETAAGYTAEQILQTLGLKEEENIFSFDPSAKEAVLEKQVPLLESIKVIRDYPSTVVVRVTESMPAYTMSTAGGWLTLSDQFKILACDAAQPAGLCTLYGGEPDSTTPGDQLTFTPEAGSASAASDASEPAAADGRLEALHTLEAKLEEYGLLSEVTRLEFGDTEQMAFLYQDRISVLLGTLNDLDYKLDRARYVLTDADGKGCGPTDTGKLDFSHTVSADSTRKIYFAQGEPTLPSGYVVPPKAEETAEPDQTADAAPDAAAAQPSQTETDVQTAQTAEGTDPAAPAQTDPEQTETAAAPAEEEHPM